MGVTFKENCPDTRNSKVYALIDELQQYGISIDAWDPWVENKSYENSRKFNFVDYPSYGEYGAIIVAVAHTQFRDMPINEIRSFGVSDALIFDVKNILPRDASDLRL